ncbi:MAG: alpha/beta fold hydrolase [Planctomycetaceae bacterium]|nr:alpha/beta fold hydrolase [Planctomycetaceae bacterium]
MILARRRIPGLELIDHQFAVPLDHDRREGERISIFAREVVGLEHVGKDLPWLIFFQGGPGYPGPRVLERTGWIDRAVKEFRVLLLDDRGTGRSDPVCAQSLARRGEPKERARYLTLFRSDAIVRDAECIRRELLGDRRWTALGQSYGGFCVTRYLSSAPEGLDGAMLTGGIPPIGRPAEDVYRATYPVVRRKNALYYERYPEDVPRVRSIVHMLDGQDVRLPGGDRLTRRRFLQLGLQFGFHDGFEKVHYLLETAFVAGRRGPELGLPFLYDFEAMLTYRQAPIFSMLQEACYAEGAATRWAAERVRGEFPEFERDEPIVLFTGEMMYRWMFDEIPHLREMKEEAEFLAAYKGWPALHDPDRLEANPVPASAIVYADDMYVERALAEEAARKIGNLSVWLTSEYEHNGLRSHGDVILDKLLGLMRRRPAVRSQ